MRAAAAFRSLRDCANTCASRVASRAVHRPTSGYRRWLHGQRPVVRLTDMEAFLVSTVVVAVGEIGDKTQLLALVLAARLKKPLPIVLGILVATLFNHTLAGLAGAWVRTMIPAPYLRWLLVASFFAVALWALKPDSMDSEPTPQSRWGAFMVTAVAFFLA